MTPLEKFYTDDLRWYEKIGDIHAQLERVKISEEQSGDVLHLRKLSRILSIHASTAIEGNRLTLNDPVNDSVNELTRRVLAVLRNNPRATASMMASTLHVSESTIKRHLKNLRQQGLLRRIGSDKTGHWEVIEGPQ